MRHSGHFLFSYLSAGFHTLVSAFVRHWASMHKQGICHFKAEIRYWGPIVEKAIRLLPTQCQAFGKANEVEPTFLHETIGMGEKKKKISAAVSQRIERQEESGPIKLVFPVRT